MILPTIISIHYLSSPFIGWKLVETPVGDVLYRIRATAGYPTSEVWWPMCPREERIVL